ncbi:MAG: hypothetical protein WD118_12075 [Phycisphaeraceae bacterium]
MTPAPPNSTFPLARSVALLVLVACAGMAVAGLILAAGGWWAQLPYAAAGGAAALLGALLALTPLGFTHGKSAAQLGPAALAAMVIRPLVTGLAVAAGVVLLNLPLRPLLLWAVGFYMILLLVEVMLISRQLRTITDDAARPPSARPALLLIASLLATIGSTSA